MKNSDKKEVSEKTIRNIMEFVDSKEMRRFSSLQVGNHIVLVQDFNRFETPHVGASHSSDDEHDWIVFIVLFFWSMEISWNGRKESWGFLAKAIYTLVGLFLVWGALVLLMEGIYYVERGGFFHMNTNIAIGILIIAIFLSGVNKVRKIFKNI